MLCQEKLTNYPPPPPPTEHALGVIRYKQLVVKSGSSELYHISGMRTRVQKVKPKMAGIEDVYLIPLHVVTERLETLRSTMRPVLQCGPNFSSKMSAEPLRFLKKQLHTVPLIRSFLYCRLEQLSRRI